MGCVPALLGRSRYQVPLVRALCADLPNNVDAVIPDREYREVEYFGDLSIGEAVFDENGNLGFPGSEVRVHYVFHDAFLRSLCQAAFRYPSTATLSPLHDCLHVGQAFLYLAATIVYLTNHFRAGW